MNKEDIEIGKKYNYKMFNEVVIVKSINSNGSVTVETSFGVMDIYPKDLEEIKENNK